MKKLIKYELLLLTMLRKKKLQREILSMVQYKMTPEVCLDCGGCKFFSGEKFQTGIHVAVTDGSGFRFVEASSSSGVICVENDVALMMKRYK